MGDEELLPWAEEAYGKYEEDQSDTEGRHPGPTHELLGEWSLVLCFV